MPAYYNAMFGIELTLKAYLRSRGVTVRALSRDFGHDLRKCYRKAKELGLGDIYRPTLDDLRAMHLLMEMNSGHRLRYIVTGAIGIPSWGIVEPSAVTLHQIIAPLVGSSTFNVRIGEGHEARRPAKQPVGL